MFLGNGEINLVALEKLKIHSYSLICEECGEEVAAYFGESGRNGYSRGGEHLVNRLAEDENKSVLKLHANHHHNGADVRFSMRVTGVHNDSLDTGQAGDGGGQHCQLWRRIFDEQERRVGRSENRKTAV